ncbi:MAG: hypothetical protein AUH30_16335 [Candidatus Rokubacteria bacterium 13_1_40CM_68_15]|nr:MAG: hypothetical protein AUH30_16335 [Candidatus Rokubacteria bacterium 13_1_40CM_68_15]
MMLRIMLVVSLAILAVIPAVPAFADRDDDDKLRAEPFVFVGQPGDCGPLPGSNIVMSAWLPGMGLPDNGGPNTATNAADRRFGLLLSKNGLTSDCSASGAEIKGFERLRQGTTPSTAIVLGFDYRNGGHCGAGAPRFNVVARPATGPDTFHFVGGCSNDTPIPAQQDPAEWTRVRFNTANPAQSFPVIPPGSRIRSIDLIFDEGTDNPVPPFDAGGVGLAVVDNININGSFIRSGRGIAPSPDDGEDRRDGGDD